MHRWRRARHDDGGVESLVRCEVAVAWRGGKLRSMRGRSCMEGWKTSSRRVGARFGGVEDVVAASRGSLRRGGRRRRGESGLAPEGWKTSSKWDRSGAFAVEDPSRGAMKVAREGRGPPPNRMSLGAGGRDPSDASPFRGTAFGRAMEDDFATLACQGCVSVLLERLPK